MPEAKKAKKKITVKSKKRKPKAPKAIKAVDSDFDGLSDKEEIKLGTDPFNPDTDGDGILDGAEVANGTNPLKSDFWKMLFIPHKHNDYQPHILHPHRLLFHAVTAVMIKVLVIGVVLGVPASAMLTPDVLSKESDQIIELTNDLRTSLNIPTLQKNSLLSLSAYDKAQDMLVRQYFSHTNPDGKKLADWLKDVGYDYAVAGENLAIGFSSAQAIMTAWEKSPTHYQNLIDKDYKQIGVAMVLGKYQGYETNITAQHFGAQHAEKNTEAYQPAAENNNLVQPENTAPVALAPAASPKPEPIVKAENISKPLVAPSLIFPANNFLTNQSKADLKISAPGAQKVQVLSQDKILGQAENFNNGNADIALELPEGSTGFLLKSFNREQEAVSAEYSITVDKTAPAADLAKTKITVSQDSKNQKDAVVLVEAYLSPDTAKASASFGENSIELKPDSTEAGKWTGQTIIYNHDQKEDFNPVVLASISARDLAGNQMTTDIDWANIKVYQPSPLEQYAFFKSHQSKTAAPLFDISSWYYKILLAVAVLALLLNIFVEIRKQHPHIILSALAMIGLLVFLIRF